MNFAHISAAKKASRSKKQAELQVKKDTWCKRIIYRKFFQLSAYKYRHTKKPELQNESEAQAFTSSQLVAYENNAPSLALNFSQMRV